MDLKLGVEMHNFAKLLWKFDRSLTGPGVRGTLLEIKNLLPNLQIKSINSGERAFDWTIPKEWSVEDAYIITPNGEKICNFKDNFFTYKAMQEKCRAPLHKYHHTVTGAAD